MNEQNLNRGTQDAEKGHKLKELFHKSDDPTVRMRRKLLFQAAAAACVCLIVAAAIFGVTAAWYSNVVKSEALSLQAEAWGFKGEITVPDSAITAAPGESGTLTGVFIRNESDKKVKVRLDVDKGGPEESPMDPELQKRLYFYYEKDGQRVWINSLQGYIFEMEPESSAEMTQVHWIWVYDLLGYYVLCSYDGSTVTEEEYLRPVEYELDTAEFDEEGTLTSPDLSILAPDENLQSVGGGYYVLTDTIKNRDGGWTGVALRLLDKTEIQQAIDYDTALAGDDPVSFSPVLRFTGENVKAESGGNTPEEPGQP